MVPGICFTGFSSKRPFRYGITDPNSTELKNSDPSGTTSVSKYRIKPFHNSLPLPFAVSYLLFFFVLFLLF